MNIDSNGSLWGALVARRLMLHAEEDVARRKGKNVKSKSAKELMDEEQALIGGTSSSTESKSRPATDDTRINLADLSQRLKSQANTNTSQIELNYTQKTTEVTINYKYWAPVEGLVVHDAHSAETDRYEFNFQDGMTFKITDKWSNKSTTIFGDPHVMTSDQGDGRNGEFSDLKQSDLYTTLMLEDGTRVTFTAQDNGLIQKVDIFKGNQHLQGTGQGSSDWKPETGLFAPQVQNDSATAKSSLSMGDVVYAGGDGNDWFNSSGQLIWGKTTGPRPLARPYASLEIQVKQTTVQVSAISSQEHLA
jgi:hypothetical protein